MKTEEYNSTKELTPENNSSQNQMNKKSKIVMGVSIGIAIAAIIVCIIVVVTTKNDDDEEEENNTDSTRTIESSNDYYISEEICESTNLCYSLINPNVKHSIFELYNYVDRTNVRNMHQYSI